MTRAIGFAAFIALVATSAGAHAVAWSHKPKAPEIDPASAMSALTMLAASAAVLRGRRSKTP